MLNIPVYRAKCIDSDEWFEGYFWKSPEDERCFIISICDLTGTYVPIHIDPSTLAISFNKGERWDNIESVASLCNERLGCNSCDGSGYVHRTTEAKDLPCIVCNTSKR